MMKKIFLLLLNVILILSCNDAWDKHYKDQTVDGEVSPLDLYEYIETTTDYSEFFKLLKATGLAGQLNKDQYLTVWAVKNPNYDYSSFGNMSDTLVAGYHINYLSFGSTDLKNGLRIQCMNGIYVNISGEQGTMFANNSRILSSIRCKNGVIHEISGLMTPLTNMFTYIKMLGDEYSMIRDSILYYNTEIFDKENSTPIGVDPTGNTVYDSVFYTNNPLFGEADFSSEYKQFTVFLPNNDVIGDCFESLHEQYSLMGKQFTVEDTIIAFNWIKEAMFHSGAITDYESVPDLVSPFSKTWRTTVQMVDKDNPITLSNGLAYNVTKLKVPNNVIITRIKSLVHYYEYLSELEQSTFYTVKGSTKTEIVQGDETPIKGTYYRLFQVIQNPVTPDELSAEFFPLEYDEVTGKTSLMKVPPGEYNLYMGFRSSGHPNCNIYFRAGENPIPDDPEPIGSDLALSSSSPWNYDRNTETDPLISRWNGLGGLVGVVNIPGNEMSTFKIKVKFHKPASAEGQKKIQIYHWSLKPTQNNY